MFPLPFHRRALAAVLLSSLVAAAAARAEPAPAASATPEAAPAASAAQEPAPAGPPAPEAAPAEPAAATAGTEPPPPGEPPAAEPELPPTPEQQRYLAAVQALEAQGGAYDPALSQELFGLGLAYQSAGRHAEAVDTLARAAHITRVNQGLYATADLPILERLIESYAALGEWDGVGSSYQQMFQIHRRNYGEQDERLLPALQRLSGWHIKAYLADIGQDPLNHLEAARNLYESSLGILRARAAPTDPRLAETLRERAIVDYYLAAYAPQPGEGFSFSTGPGAATDPGPSYALAGFTSGREALERVVELRRQDPQSSALQRGEALAELGDWHQLFNRRQTAMGIYQEAWGQAAADAASDQALARIFGRPVALPVLPRGLEEAADASVAAAAEPASITVAFAVNEKGVAEDIRVLESAPPAADAEVDKLRKRLKTSRFRPRFEGGVPVPTPDVTYQYRYSP